MPHSKSQLALDRIKLTPQSRPFSTRISAGSAVALMGATGSGKSRLIETIVGQTRLAGGSVQAQGPIVRAGREGIAWRLTPQGFAKKLAGKNRTAGFAEALTACGLWDARKEPLSRLAPSQLAACEILPLLLQDTSILIVDQTLDLLDPWVLSDVLDLLMDKIARGSVLLAATHRPDIAARLGQIIVMKGLQVAFCGSLAELLAKARPEEVCIEAHDRSSVRALVAPFAIHIEETEGSLLVTAHDGQELAARLLTHGYGNVKLVSIGSIKLEDALRSLH